MTKHERTTDSRAELQIYEARLEALLQITNMRWCYERGRADAFASMAQPVDVPGAHGTREAPQG